MSKQMLENFFPASIAFATRFRFLSFLHHEVIFPDDVAEACPEYVLSVGEISIRQPTLFLSAMWGSWIGISHYCKLCYRDKKYWARAFLAFGIMNLSAIFLHCILPMPKSDYPSDYPMFWMIDTFATGMSGSNLLVASLYDLQSYFRRLSLIPYWSLNLLLVLVGMLCCIWFTLDATSMWSQRFGSYPLEIWYIAPCIFAILPVLIRIYADRLAILHGNTLNLPTNMNLLVPLSMGQWVVTILIPIVGIGGIMMDRFWCTRIGNNLLRDALSANTCVFLGCDLAFWSVNARLIETPLKKGGKKHE